MGTDVKGYVDLYLLPVPAEKMEEYRDLAMIFGGVAKEHGALSYREFRGDDLDAGFTAAAADGQVLTAAVVDFESRSHRDEVMAKVMEDPRIKAMMDVDPVTDMEQMRYGGFKTFVDA